MAVIPEVCCIFYLFHLPPSARYQGSVSSTYRVVTLTVTQSVASREMLMVALTCQCPGDFGTSLFRSDLLIQSVRPKGNEEPSGP